MYEMSLWALQDFFVCRWVGMSVRI